MGWIFWGPEDSGISSYVGLRLYSCCTMRMGLEPPCTTLGTDSPFALNFSLSHFQGVLFLFLTLHLFQNNRLISVLLFRVLMCLG